MSHTYQNLELGERASLSGRTSDDAASSSYEDEPSLFRQYRTWLTGLGVVGVVCLVGCVAFASRPATTAATTTTAAAGPLLAATTVDEFDSTAASSFVLSSSSAGSSKSLDKAHKSAELATATAEAICLDPDYTKVTLKTANEMTMAGLYPDLKGERKFEASDVIRVGDHYLVVYDNLYQIGKIHQQLDFHSSANILMNSDPERVGDSGFEAIVYDEPTGVFYVVIEAELLEHDDFHRAHIDSVSSDQDPSVEAQVPDVKQGQFHAFIEEVEFHEDSKEYKLKAKCRSQFKFISGNKGFEGAAHINQNGDLLMMGLCEGNFCEGGKRGRQAGNGRIVLMRKRAADDEAGTPCEWETVSLLALPKLAAFSDYSALAARPVAGEKNVYRIAVTSQESSQVWIGELKTSAAKDAEDWSLTDGVVYNFPRSNGCEIVYCNIEGVAFVDDNLLVAVSDKMKSGGRQHYRCLQKDQSIHTFVLP